jgi:BirA family biotin operon repressor/biotin-[acetyl-CoA-carboxylase] ligase
MGKLIFDYQQSLSSTNTALKNKSLTHEGQVLLAEVQLNGKGMGSNHWESLQGKNITGSILFEPLFLMPSQAFLISMAVSIGIISFLQTAEIKGQIKWPNDIYVDNKKLAGILIENEFTSHQINRTIAGIGLNVNQTKFSLAPNPVSLKLLTQKEYKIKTLAEKLFQIVYEQYILLKTNPGKIQTEYFKLLLGTNQWLTYSDENEKFEGKITEVAIDGQISIIDKSGKIRNYYFKEVELIN